DHRIGCGIERAAHEVGGEHRYLRDRLLKHIAMSGSPDRPPCPVGRRIARVYAACRGCAEWMIAFDFELARTSPKCAVEQTSESVIAQGDGLGCDRSRQEARDRMQAREVAKASIRCSSSGVSTAAFILGSPVAREAQLRFENAATRDGLGF